MKKIMILWLLVFGAMQQVNAQSPFKALNDVKGLKVGEQVDNFTASDQDGLAFGLKETLTEGPVVVLFYRGQWCPICNRFLSEMQSYEEEIKILGASIIAISPDQQEDLKKVINKTKVSFRFLHDDNLAISKQFDVAFLMMDKNMEGQGLPVPATFVIDRDGKIIWRHFDSDYRQRANPKEIIQALQNIH